MITLTDVQKLILIEVHNGQEGNDSLTVEDLQIIKTRQPHHWPHHLQVKTSKALEHYGYTAPPKPITSKQNSSIPKLATGTYNPIRDEKDKKIFADEMNMTSTIGSELSSYSIYGKMYLSIIRLLHSEFQKRANEANNGLLTFEELDTLSIGCIYQNVAIRKNNMFWIFSGRLKEDMTNNRVRSMFYAALAQHLDGDPISSELVKAFLHPSID